MPIIKRIEGTRFGIEVFRTVDCSFYRVVEIVTDQGHYIDHGDLYSTEAAARAEVARIIQSSGVGR